jgi:hypothetical protein
VIVRISKSSFQGISTTVGCYCCDNIIEEHYTRRRVRGRSASPEGGAEQSDIDGSRLRERVDGFDYLLIEEIIYISGKNQLIGSRFYFPGEWITGAVLVNCWKCVSVDNLPGQELKHILSGFTGAFAKFIKIMDRKNRGNRGHEPDVIPYFSVSPLPPSLS